MNDDFSFNLWRYDGTPGELIPLLQSAQNHFGYIPRRAISYISAVTGIPESEVYGVITFYSQFRLRPMGKYVIRACDGTACHVSGAEMIIETIQDELGVEVGETTEDGLFTLNTVACIGC
ncbi:MAG TPA: NAD(P)H-dependent oxidoreductase subunit E, partial [Candidatus Krumholzibacteriaceae bacterium]|nr:NAD(P)H-dependent oxidoreductase subunit E [Candidatus Krumholzibacteriaceae bacterium]